MSPKHRNHDIVQVEGTVVHETELVYKFESALTGNVGWVPKKFCEKTDDGLEGEEWVFLERELI